MKKAPMVLASILLFTAAFAQETVTLPAKPSDPRAGRVLQLREVLRISDSGGAFFFKSPENIQPAPDGGVLVVDENEFLRFDARGKFIVNMFRAGQGPGEFGRIDDYLVRGTGILAFQGNPMKCVFADLDGKFLREVKPDAPVSRLFGRCGDRLLAAKDSFPALDKVQKPEGELLDIVWTLKLMNEEGRVEATSLAYPTKWFAKRLGRAFIADNVTFLHCAPLEDGLVAVAHEEGYAVKIADPRRNAAVRTIRRDYRRVKYEPEKDPDPPGGARGLAFPLAHFNDIQRLYAVDGRIWAVTSTRDPAKGVLVDVISPRGEYLDSFYLPLPKGVSLQRLVRHPLTISGRTMLTLEFRENGELEVVKYEIVD
jgi:6-bladed beta-propeller